MHGSLLQLSSVVTLLLVMHVELHLDRDILALHSSQQTNYHFLQALWDIEACARHLFDSACKSSAEAVH